MVKVFFDLCSIVTKIHCITGGARRQSCCFKWNRRLQTTCLCCRLHLYQLYMNTAVHISLCRSLCQHSSFVALRYHFPAFVQASSIIFLFLTNPALAPDRFTQKRNPIKNCSSATSKVQYLFCAFY